MPFSFIDDPRWQELDKETKTLVVNAAFEDQIASDPRWAEVDTETRQQIQAAFFEDADAYSKQREPHADGFLGALAGGVKQAANSVRTAANVFTNDEADVRELTQDASKILKTPQQQSFNEALQARKADDNINATGWGSFKQGVSNVAGAVLEEPLGALHEAAGQVPNAGVIMGSMWAGAKAGAMAGAMTANPVGIGVGGLAGSIIGALFGDVAIETGGIAQEQVNDGEYNRDDALKKGIVKGSIIAAVDVASMGLSKAIFTPAFKAANEASQKAIQEVLKASKINPFDDAAVKVALSQDKSLKNAVMQAGAKAASEAAPKGVKGAGLFGTGMAIDTTMEGVGEYYGSKIAGLDADATDAILEAAMSIPHGVAEVSIGKTLAKAKEILPQSVGGDVSNIGTAITADEAVQAFESSVSADLDTALATKPKEAVPGGLLSTEQNANHISQESDQFGQFQEEFRDQKINQFEQNLKQAQTDITEYQDRPPIQPDVEALRREYEDKQAPRETESKLSTPQGMLYSQQQQPVAGPMPDSGQQAAKLELEQATGMGLKDKGQQAFVDKRIQKLGSIDAVDKAYGRDDNVSQYARAKAREVFGQDDQNESNIGDMISNSYQATLATQPNNTPTASEPSAPTWVTKTGWHVKDDIKANDELHALSFKELGKRSDDLQALIDKKHDELYSQGISSEDQENDTDLSNLYNQRIKYDSAAALKGYEGAKGIIADELGITKSNSIYASIDSILRDHYGLSNGGDSGSYMMAKYTSQALNNPENTIINSARDISKILLSKSDPGVDYYGAMESSLSGLSQAQKREYIEAGVEKAKKIHDRITSFFLETHEDQNTDADTQIVTTRSQASKPLLLGNKDTKTVEPGQSVTWQDKKGKVISGKVIKKQSEAGRAWQVIKTDGKKTFVHEKHLSPVDAEANNQQVQEQGAVSESESGSDQVDRGSQSQKNEPQSGLPSTGETQTLPKYDIPSNTLKKAQKEANRVEGIAAFDREKAATHAKFKIDDLVVAVKDIGFYGKEPLRVKHVQSDGSVRIETMEGKPKGGHYTAGDFTLYDMKEPVPQETKPEAKPTIKEQSGVEKLESDLSSKGTGSIKSDSGLIDYSIQAKDDGNGFYFQYVEDGARHTQGGAGANRWSQQEAIDKAGADAKGRYGDPGGTGKPTKEVTNQDEYGAKNKVFTAEAADKAREILRKKLSGNQLNSGIDPEVLLAGIQLGGYHIEAGARTFAAYSKAMIQDVGETVKPYLRSFYEGVRHFPGFDSSGMTESNVLDNETDAIENEVTPTSTPEPTATIEEANDDRSQEDAERPGIQNLDQEYGEAVPGGRDGVLAGNVEPQTTGYDNVLGISSSEDVRGPEKPGSVDGDGVRSGVLYDGGVGRTERSRDEQFGREAASGTGLDDNGSGGLGRTGGAGRPGEPDRVLENYHIEDPEALIGGTPKVRFKKNQKAIEVFNEVSNEGRRPTAEERDAIASYIGWGSFGQELFQGTFENPTYKDGWANEGEWLRSHLGKSAWESAQASIINAHYTDPPTVSAIWDIVKQLGFNGGRVLEPSMGIGNFFGLMPKGLKSNSDLTGIELDETTSGMAKMLYPEANIQQMGYQDSKTADGFYDLVLGNWPFAAQGPADRRYNKYHLTLHDYFFIKALDQVREGGLVVGITASGTMDKVGKLARLQMGKRADLVAAFRMPTGAFQKYAGTSVVADVIILQKRSEGATANHDATWLENTVLGKAADGKEIKVNEYWTHKPENVLGNMTIGHGTTQGREGMIVERQHGYEDVLSSLAERLPKNIITKRGQIDHVKYIANNTTERQNSVTIKDNGLYIVRGERLARLDDTLKYSVKDEKETAAREAELKSMVRIRERYGKLLDAERNGEKTAENHRAILNQLYKAFVKKYGNMNGSFALKHFVRAGDPMAPAMAALEKNTGTKENPVYEPAKIFTQSTQRKKTEIKNPSISDAFVMTRNEVARVVDIESIAEKAGTTPEAVKAELIKKDAVFETPAGTFEVKDIYLSGNVREKLREAKAAKEDGLDMDRNIKALEAVIPDDIPYFNIEATMGAAWIPSETYKQFITETANLPDANGIHITPSNNGWIVKFDDAGQIDGRQEVKTIWSTPGASFTKILRSAFTGQVITIKTKDEDGNEYVDKEMSTSANEKVGALREALKDWIWKDVDRRVDLEQHYNETMNAWATPAYDGSFLSFDGMMLQKGESEFNLRKHQVNAIWRGVANGRGLYAHEVGTGKAQPIDSKILTPHGWKLMGDIHVNDQVITQNGAPTNVEAVFPQGEKDIYRVLFSDGACTECCEEHLWLTQTYRERNQTINAIRFGKDWDCAKPKIRSLSEIKETLVSPHLSAKNHSIPTVEPVLFESQDVQIDPYLMGVLLGDGNMSHRSVTITSKDNEIINNLDLPENVELRRCESKGRCSTWGLRIIKQQGFGSNKESNPVVYSLESLGLMGKRSYSKFIPDAYLFNSIQNRISLLHGLMDTDGYVSKTGHSVYFYTVSSRLANDVVSLVQSLGGVVNRTIKNPTYSYNGEKRKGKECHVLCVKMPPSINPFKMERKASLVKPKEKYGPVRYIVDVKYVGKKQAQCIRVSDPSHLYVTDDFIVTHNTFTMGGIAVESRRYGLAKKPLILGHNANSASVADDIQSMYPGAKVLYIDNLTPKTIDQKLYQIANDDWDAVVLPHSLLDRLTLSRETLDRLAQDEIMSLEEEAIASAAEEGFDIEKILDDEEALRKIRGATTAKEMVKQRNRIIQNIEKQAQAASREGAIPFESLGIDMLIVDEVHEFKKPPLSTKMKVKGLNTTASGRSIGLNFLASYIKEQNNGKGVHIFTGTPITNTLNEIYNHMRYIMSNEMEKSDVLSWDSWFNTFASVESDIERTSSGEYEMVSRLSGFHNVSELRKFAGQYMDIVFAEDMPEFVPRKTKSGKDLHSNDLTDAEREELVNGRVDEGSPSGRPYKKLVNEVADMSEEQRGILQTLVARAKSYKEASGKERMEIRLSGDPRNPVIIETDAAKAGFDPRLYDKELSDHPQNKINRCVNNVLKHYQEHEKASQVIFMENGYNDQATRSKRDGAGEKATYKVDTFNAAQDLKRKLIEGGIPAGQIAIVNGSVDKKKRMEIADQVNSGEVRVVIGLTSTLGTGTNMQENLRAMHHLDAPWMPGELEQRNGRGHRQGNRWNTVLEYRYITESIDARRWQVLAKKQKMITDFLKAKEGVRSIEGDAVDLGSSDLDEINSSFSEAAGDARILIREKLKKDIEKLERKERTHSQGIVDAKNRIKYIEGRSLPNLKDKVNGLKSDTEHYQLASKEPWAITIDGKKYTKRQEANVALEKLSLKLSTRDMRLSEKKKIGAYRGFDIMVSGSVGNGNTYSMERDLSYPIKPATGSIDFLTRSFPSMLDNTMGQVEEETSALDKFKQVAKEPFAQEKALQSKKESLDQLERDLESNPDAPPSWLAQGAPVGTDVYYKGEKWEVDGHRKGEHGHYVIIKQGENQEVVDYLEVMDENNMPVYETLDGDSGAKYSTSTDATAKPQDQGISQIDKAPGQGITIDKIKSQYKNQQITTNPDGTLSILFKNGHGIRVKTVDHIGGDDIRFAMESGRMDKRGVILGKYQDGTVTINKTVANMEIAIHENVHALKALGMITKADEKTLNNLTKLLQSQKKYRYEIQEDMEENQANTMAQLVADRANYREGSNVHALIQKIADFFDALFHIGRQSARKLAREYESGNIYSREAKTKSNQRLNGAQYSVSSDVTETEQTTAYKQIASGLKNVLSNHKNKGQGYKPDIGVLENTLGLMSHYSENIHAMKLTFDELLKRPEWKHKKENELSKNGEESMIGTMEDLKKHNKVSYDILKDYLIDNDINQVGAVIFQDEDGTWTIKSEKDKKTGKRTVLEEGIATKQEARALVIEYEVDAYPDPSGSDALRAFRTLTSNLHDFYAESWEAIIKDYEDRGLTLPQVVTKTKSGDVRIDLKVALAQMGDRSSYYFPRQRSNGDWQVYGKKQGGNDFVDYRDNKVTADYLAGKMKAQGYDVEVDKIGSMSEDIYQSVKNILATQVMVNQALNEIKLDAKQRKLGDIGLSGEWRGQDYFIPNGGVYEWSSSVLKDLGGREYSDHGRDGRSWSPGYWFEKAPKDIEELVTNALYISIGHETDISFEISQSLANQLSDTLRARGSRARMIARSDAVGKAVQIGYETDPVSAIAQAVNSAAGGYAKQQVAMNTSKAITGQHYTWEEWQKQHQDYDALVNAEDELAALTKNSDTEEERIADIDREIKDLHREGAGVATESEKARQDRLFRIGKLFREKEKIRKWEDDKQAAKMHQEIARLRSNIHKEYRAYIQDNMLDSKKQKRAYDDAVNAVENVLKNDEAGDRVINTLKGLASVWFLGGRLSSAAINLTAIGTTVPAAMDAYGGIPLQRTVKHIAKAGKAYMSFVTGKGNVSQADRSILEDIFARGWVAAQLNMETVNALKSGPAQKYGRAVELLMTPFKITEEFNRGTTILAAYKGVMAENPGMSREDALAKAKKVSDRAHGIYGVENQPALLRKGRGLRAASAMYIFQTYLHNYLTTLAYMIGRRQAKAATYMILSPMVFGGAASSLLMPAIKMIFKALDEDDPEERIYQISEELFGEKGGDIARYGLPGLAGVNFKGSLAPNMPDFQEPLDALGPIGGMMRNIYDGAVNITNGDYLKGIEKISPLVIGNVAKAYRESTQGVTTRAGDPVFFGNKQIKGDFGTGLMRAAGMNPTKISKPREVQWHETELKQQYAERKRNIYSRIIRYHAQPGSEKNPDKWKEIIMDIKEFNARVKSNGFNDVVPLITHKTIKARVKRAFRPNKRERLRDDM